MSDIQTQKEPESFYWLGVDSSLALGDKSDPGALAVIRGRSRLPPENGETKLSDILSDWELGMIYARNVLKHSVRQWAGLIHQKHEHFGFSHICIDAGAGGCGPAIMLELKNSKILMPEGERELTPILTMDNMAVKGQFILSMFRRDAKRKIGVELVWPGEKGDDVLNDKMHVVFKEAVDAGEIAFPVPFNLRRRETTLGWSEEKCWASKCLDQMVKQLAAIKVLTEGEGEEERFVLTRNGARQFKSKGHDDLARAGMYAYVAFLVWLKSWKVWGWRREEDSVGFSTW